MKKRKAPMLSKSEEEAVSAAARDDPDNPPLSEADFKRMRRRGRPPGSNKVRVQGYFDKDVVAHFKAGGAGYTSRMNAALKKAIEKGLA